MSKIGIVALAAIAALVLGIGANMGSRTANAEVDGTLAIWCGFVGALDVDGDADVDAADTAAACDGLTAAEIATIAAQVGDEDTSLEAGELDDLDLDANQVTVTGNGILSTILIIAFVDDDDIVTFDAPTGAGVTVTVSSDGVGGETPADDGNAETCEGDDDQDCGTSTLGNGDGVAVATITTAAGADAGDEVDIDVSQEGVSSTETLTVVGTGDDITLTLVEPTIQTDADTSEDCTDPTELEVSDSDALSNVDSTIAIVTATDNDGTEITREIVTISSADTDIADIGDTSFYTVDAGDVGIGFFAVVCGMDETGTTDIEATGAGEDASAEITVVGPAANVTLAASPAAIPCDGTQTSTVTATVTDADGNNVANGTSVQFNVVAFGTANPINTTTTDGTASSTITPLSGITAGTTVNVVAGSAQASIRVDCLPSLATQTAVAATATPTSGVRPPDAGNGGYLGQDSAAGFPLWALFALALGSVALVVGGKVYGRVR